MTKRQAKRHHVCLLLREPLKPRQRADVAPRRAHPLRPVPLPQRLQPLRARPAPPAILAIAADRLVDAGIDDVEPGPEGEEDAPAALLRRLAARPRNVA